MRVLWARATPESGRPPRKPLRAQIGGHPGCCRCRRPATEGGGLGGRPSHRPLRAERRSFGGSRIEVECLSARAATRQGRSSSEDPRGDAAARGSKRSGELHACGPGLGRLGPIWVARVVAVACRLLLVRVLACCARRGGATTVGFPLVCERSRHLQWCDGRFLLRWWWTMELCRQWQVLLAIWFVCCPKVLSDLCRCR
jgi:hypothetical protein